MLYVHKLSLSQRLIAITLLTVISLTALFVGVLYTERELLLRNRKEKVRNLVEAAYGVLAEFERRQRDGKLTQEEAQTGAMAMVRGMRYEKTEYFWINDLGLPVPKMVMHPTVPALDGKVLDDAKFNKATSMIPGIKGAPERLDNKNLFLAFNDVVRKADHGYVLYDWPKPLAGGGTTTELFTKLSYVKKFEPWGWVIGSGIYIDDVERIFREEALKFLTWGTVIALIIAVPLMLLRRGLLRLLGGDPARAVAAARAIAAGDLSTEVKTHAGDSTSLLAGMKDMQAHLRGMINDVTKGAERLAVASKQMMVASENVSAHASQQSDSASVISVSVEEMTVSMSLVEGSAREAFELSRKAGDLAESGNGVIQNAVTEMRRLSDAVHDSAKTIEDLGQQSEQISSIVNTIKEIADQTNLLALNAAIEAARAGEQGRGFAVVADEVRKLAERTSRSTRDIANTIGSIQAGTHGAVTSMEAGVAQANAGVALAEQGGESISQIRDSTQRVVAVVNDISGALREQGAATSQISLSVGEIVGMSERTAAALTETVAAARRLLELSETLQGTVGRFKTA